MNNPVIDIPATERGLYNKYDVRRVDGSSEPGGKHHDDEYFVLSLTTDKHAIAAIAAYADSCVVTFPQLAADLRAKVASSVADMSEFVQVPETTLPNGHIEPPFLVMRYLTSKGPSDIPMSTHTGQPWVQIDFYKACAVAQSAGYKLITETQALAIAYNVSQQAINWTGGEVGKGNIYQGLHKGDLDEAQPASYVSPDLEERRWHELSNGERVYDFAGNAYSWIFDNVQGDDAGLIAKPFAEDSPSIATAPCPSMENGVGWYPGASSDWSGYALVRGGCWGSGGDAGVFHLSGGWPVSSLDLVGFRCTK